MDFGLRQQDLNEIVHLFHTFPAIEEAILFGSRAKGTFKKGSDIDIAVRGKGIDYQIVTTLSYLLNEESSMPYFFDIVHLDSLSDQELRAHISRVGQRIYAKMQK
ncbi:nucleotidyltransferase domain-containing protein, partial [bacterium]|nr:nucleotidyltransferase domain-containing protein [bacterium]